VHGQVYRAALLLWAVSSGALAQEIPAGFKVDRYVGVWERNPFTLVKPGAPQKLPSPFDNIFLASWLEDGGKETIIVQNSENNEVQMITAVPNQNNLRLLELRLDPNPRSVEAVISDGKERGTVRFRLNEKEKDPSDGMNSPSVQVVPRVPVESGWRQPPVRRKHLLNRVEPEGSNSGHN